ncbi:SDR family oxidoreductase [Microlunatus endophyticus]|uniref:SDR family oxidoreductase n=1 Tax=Microlunatus endophyticus TaxID=1716077 RepID=UPI001E3E1096|nr:NAD(P)H-binding protein [Microlunatus endophyticus]
MGARGSIGRHVLDELIARGEPVRASARKPEAGQFPENVDVFAADLTDPASLTAAFEGVGHVFLYANHDGVAGVIEAAKRAGVEKIVLMSSGSIIHPTSAGNAITEEHREIEDAFAAATDLTVVPIRPLVLATNTLGWAWPIKAAGTVPLYKPDAVTAPIHEKDIAAVAVAALLGDENVSGMLTGPDRISQRDQVAAIGAAIGRDLAVVEQTREEASTNLSKFMPESEVEAVLQFLDDADAGNSPATNTVRDVLGRVPLGFDVWAVDHARDFS